MRYGLGMLGAGVRMKTWMMAALLGLVAAGCGKDDGNAPSPASPEPTPTTKLPTAVHESPPEARPCTGADVAGVLKLATSGEGPPEVLGALVQACSVPSKLARAVTERVFGSALAKRAGRTTGGDGGLGETAKLCPGLAAACAFKLGVEVAQDCRAPLLRACDEAGPVTVSAAEAATLPAHAVATMELLSRWLIAHGAKAADAHALSRFMGRDLLTCAADHGSLPCRNGLARRGAAFGVSPATARGLELVVAEGQRAAKDEAVPVVVGTTGITYGEAHAVPIDCATLKGEPCSIGVDPTPGTVRWTIPDSHLNATDPLRLDDLVRSARRLAGDQPAPPALIVLDRRMPAQVLRRVVHSLVEARHRQIALAVADPRYWSGATLQIVPLALGEAVTDGVVASLSATEFSLSTATGAAGAKLSLGAGAPLEATAQQLAAHVGEIPPDQLGAGRITLRFANDATSSAVVTATAALATGRDGKPRAVALDLTTVP